MINEQELNISNKSYVNKDFATIYPELLNLVKQLTNRWDPETSNESDPGIVLLKLLAFIGDKNNYNTDKNILERFMPSATQESSMRQLCEMLGYNMHYYRAAETEVNITYTGEDASFILPALDTTLTNSDNSLTFVLTESCSIEGRNKTKKVSVIQGTCKTLTVLDSETITLENLDDNNRVYFPETMVAENGIFIKGGSGRGILTKNEYWVKVDNLNNQLPGYCIYKFGFDSTQNLPYIEFPSDIANLIGDGLTIKYIVTDGVNGNIKANTITTILSPTTIEGKLVTATEDGESTTEISFSGDNNGGVLTIKNSSAAINGADPETINEAYNSYKKVVGTFNTLVTTRDYANAIYNMYNDYDNPVVSNAQVADRRDDINYSNQIISYDENGVFTDLNVFYSDTLERDFINAFDLLVYALNPIELYSKTAYNISFQPIVNINTIATTLESSACISHDYKVVDFENRYEGNIANENQFDHVFLIKNYYKLNANISTTYKVNNAERLDIISNVETALIKNFNARELDYGYEIPFDTLLSVIENADERIKNVSLAEPVLRTAIMNSAGKEINLISKEGKKPFLKLLAKNIIAGRISLFNYDRTFGYALGQVQVDENSPMIFKKVKYLETKATITIPKEEEYTLKQNEVIQVIGPNLITEVTYPYGVNYHYHKGTSGTSIPRNVEYQLKNDEYLMINYVDSNDIEHVITYTANTIEDKRLEGGTLIGSVKKVERNIFRSSCDIPDTMEYANYDGENGWEHTPIIKNWDNTDHYFFTVGTNDTIEKRNISETTLENIVPCYWLINNVNNELKWNSDGTYMLQDNEYFFYTDSGYKDLVSLGSGTILKRNNATLVSTSSSQWIASKVDALDVLENGVLALRDKWVNVNNSPAITNDKIGKGISIQETQILTLTTGDMIMATKEVGPLSNDLLNLDSDVQLTYTTNGETVKLTNYNIVNMDSTNTDYCWKIRSRLDINAGPQNSQPLLENQSIKVYYINPNNEILTEDYELKGDKSGSLQFSLSQYLQLVGSDNVDLSETEATSVEPYFTTSYNTDLYWFEQESSVVDNPYGYSSISIKEGAIAEIGDGAENTKNQKTYSIPNIGKSYIILFYLNSQNITETDYVKIENTDCEVKDYSTNQEINTINPGMNILLLTPSSNKSSIKLVINSDSDISGTLIIGQLDAIENNFNSDLGLDIFVDEVNDEEIKVDSLQEELLTIIKELSTDKEGKNMFYYNNVVSNSKAISFSDDYYMASPYVFFDPNNIATKFTLAEIDFNNSSIDVVRSSRLND